MGLSKERDRIRKEKPAESKRDITLPLPVDLARRRACINDPFAFMQEYFGWIFWQPFTDARRKMVDSIIRAARYSGDYAVADKRGGGKSAIALFTTFWLTIRSETELPLIVGKNQKGAETELANLKHAIVESPSFSDDFPEICVPIIRLEDWASTARKQTVGGFRTKIGWEKDCLFLPTVPPEALPRIGKDKWPDDEPSYAKGQGIAVVGIDCRIRGFKRRNTRPGLVVIDDIDDRESARSEIQIKDRQFAIDQDCAGLAGSGKRCSRVMLCTTLNDQCIAAIYTSKPSWNPQRFRAITKMPERTDLRDEYISLRRTPDAEKPNEYQAFYAEHQADIEAGGEVENQYDFVHENGEDGKPLEFSAFQHYLNFIADNDWPAFLCEYQNDPPPANPDELVLTAHRIQNNFSGYGRRVVPNHTVAITTGVDIKKDGLHYVTIAWDEVAAGSIIEHDFFRFMTEGKKASDCEVLILEGLLEWYQKMQDVPYLSVAGETFLSDVTLIDTGWKEAAWHTQPVQVFCSQVGFDRFKPAKGQPHYSRPKTRGIKIGDNWHIDRIKRCPIVIMNADHWKLKVHEGFLGDKGAAGSLRVFDKPIHNGRVERDVHLNYAHQILAERWDQQKLKWSDPTKANHYFDATYLAIVGRSICGIHVVPQSAAPPVPPPSERPTAAQLAGRK
jgi:hypothetical protein